MPKPFADHEPCGLYLCMKCLSNINFDAGYAAHRQQVRAVLDEVEKDTLQTLALTNRDSACRAGVVIAIGQIREKLEAE